MNCPESSDISSEAYDSASPPATASQPSPAVDYSASPDTSAWRDELSQRLNRYRARRKMSGPRYPSLQLPFDPVPFSGTDLSLNSASQPAPETTHPTREKVGPEEVPGPLPYQQALPVPDARNTRAKIIEFPRFAWAPPPPPPDQLAEPVIDRPRILEVPEVEPPPPALGGITIEPAPHQDAERQPGIDFPLQSASLARRIVASMIDGLIIAIAFGIFAAIFWRVTAVRPPLVQLLWAGGAIFCLFWAVYQYLLIVYSARTPGLIVAGLTLARFDGAPTIRSLRRWRVLASYLSAASLGMGYAWVFLDEDALCWHDRITHTYLAPNKRESK
jgi:uncharacterized RDD family membrane protein YckC